MNIEERLDDIEGKLELQYKMLGSVLKQLEKQHAEIVDIVRRLDIIEDKLRMI